MCLSKDRYWITLFVNFMDNWMFSGSSQTCANCYKEWKGWDTQLKTAYFHLNTAEMANMKS